MYTAKLLTSDVETGHMFPKHVVYSGMAGAIPTSAPDTETRMGTQPNQAGYLFHQDITSREHVTISHSWEWS